MTVTATPPAHHREPPPLPPRRTPLQRAVGLVASMRLTVVLLVLLGVLTFFGTLAQVQISLYEVQRDYFESLLVVHDTGVILPFSGGRTVRLPLPGGLLLMSVLFVNLVAGGIVRLRWRSRNAGILVTHLGIALLLVAGFVKLRFSYAGYVSLFEGEQTASMLSFHEHELALLRRGDGAIVERTLPADRLWGATGGETVRIDQPELPFTIEIAHWLENCRPMQKGPMFEAPLPVVPDAPGTRGNGGNGGNGGGDAPGGDRPGVFLQRRDKALEQEQNTPGCYVTVTERATGRQHRGLLWGWNFRPFDERRFPFTFTAGGEQWGLDLRPVTWDLPFAVRLDRFKKTDHPGTMTPRDFSSWVTVLEDGREREAHIYMNAPLRKDGYVFYQTNWGPQPQSGMRGPPWWSVFEVAKNPSDAWPKYASYVVGLGLLGHFLAKLFRHLSSSSRRQSLPEMS